MFFLAALFELYTEKAQQISKMTTGEEKVFAVLEFHSHQSDITVQRCFRTKYKTDGPHANCIRRWYVKYKDSGCLYKGKSTGRPQLSKEKVESVQVSFTRSPQKSKRKASRGLNIPQLTVWKILRKRLKQKLYQLKLPQALTPIDKVNRFEFCTQMQQFMDEAVFLETCLQC